MPIPLGPFELDRPLARGGQGEVWRARHRRSGIAVAVKVLFSEAAREPRALAVFRNEIRAMAGLDHPGIAMILDFGAIDAAAAEASEGRLVEGSPYFAMEFASGGSLEGSRPQGWAALRAVLVGLLDALAHAHARGIIHRDLKPANALFCTEGDPRPGLKLADFGISARGDGALEDGVYGTLAYMAPEQIIGDFRAQGAWTDLYSVGCMAFELACGRLPFDAEEPIEWARAHTQVPPPALDPIFEVPEGFDDWVDRLLSKDPHRRFQRAADAAAALDDLDRAWELDAPPMPPTWRISRRFVRSMQLTDAGLGLFELRAPPLVGRAAERDRLWAALREVAAAREPRLVFVTGPAGFGKTRLLDWLVERAHELGAGEIARMWGAEAPSSPLRDMAERIVGVTGVEPEEMGPRAGAWCSAHDLDSRDALALMSWLARTAVPEARERHLLVGRLLARLGAFRPVVLVGDDVVSSPDLVAFAEQVLQRRLPVLVVLAARDESLSERPAEAARLEALAAAPGAARIRLGPLSADESVRLLTQRLMIDPVLAAQVAERATGNPAFAVHMVGDWVARGRLELADGGFVLAAGDDGVPPDIETVWDRRLARLLDGLDPSARAVLERAAVLDHAVDFDEWQEATDDPEGDENMTTRFSPRRERIRVAIEDRLLAEGLARASEDGFVFAQPMVRETLVRSAREGGRLAEHHRACSAMLRRRLHHRQPGVSERLGRHLLAAGDPGAAIGPLWEGIEERLRAVGVREALALIGTCESAMRALDLQEWDQRWGRLWCRRAALHRLEGELAECLRWAGTALEHARANGGDEVRCDALYERVIVGIERGEPTADDVAELAALLEEGRSSPEASGKAWLAIGRAALDAGELDRAVSAFIESKHLLTALSHEPEATECVVGLGATALAAGRTAEARGFFEKAMERHREAGRRFGVADAVALLAEVDRAEGDLEAAERGHRAAVAMHDDSGSIGAAWARVGLASLLVATGRAEEAHAVLEPALAIFEAAGAEVGAGRARALLAASRPAT